MTVVFQNFLVALVQVRTVATSVWEIIPEHFLAMPASVIAIVTVLYQQQHRLLEQMLHNIYTNVGFDVVVGLYHTGTEDKEP